MPEATERLLATVRRRLLIALVLEAIGAGLVLVTAVVVGARAFGAHSVWVVPAAGLLGLAVAMAIVSRGWQRLAPASVAAAIESREANLDNLLVTLVELSQRGRPVHPLILGALEQQTDARVRSIAAPAVAPLGRALTLALAIGLGTGVAWWGVSKSRVANADASTVAETPGADVSRLPRITITVTPPAYTSLPSTSSVVPDTSPRLDARSLEEPRESSNDGPKVEVLEGSRLRIDVQDAPSEVQLIETGRAPITFQRNGDSHSVELTAERTRFLLVRFGTFSATHKGWPSDRVIALLVKPDHAPVVRIRQPARDLVFAEPRGRVPIDVEASDDLAIASLSLRYTRVFGSGESMTFQEGDLPLRIERVGPGQWRAASEISLEGLQLADGDTLVYRATTRDTRPGRDPSSSETYLLEVGKLAGVASAGFALPEDKDRQAISQQMVIVKTERLLAERDRLSPAEVEERARLLAVEQRMVRAEFVFMTGGEVEDEVAEAEHSHELAEGRFENEGQVELLTAIREMSRAEARLNDAAVENALTFERAALKALQRAFDRRRYLLRTMPERARIDQTRRLTGTLTDARSWRRPAATTGELGNVEPLEALARDLVKARDAGTDVGALAARLGTIDPSAPEVQEAALRLSAAGASMPERVAAIDRALQLLADRARKALSPTRTWVSGDPAAGHFADALAQKVSRR